jgi:GMP synthase-like glutamine amidotransferase
MKNLRIHYFQHVAFEGLGYIEEWALQNGHILTATRFFEEQKLPSVDDIDWLIIMGGPMGVYDDGKFPWLKTEKEFIRRVIEANKTVIGICLGSQLIAEVLGAEVFPNKEKEIGWFDVSLTPEGRKSLLFKDVEHVFEVFHWHGDTFNLPGNAVHLIESPGCKNQAFMYGDKVLGLQFHLEATAATLKEMLEHGKEELTEGNYIQCAETILARVKETEKTNLLLKQVLDKLASPIR